MLKEITNINTRKRDLRIFGLMIGFIMLFISVYLFYEEHNSYFITAVISFSFMSIGVLFPIFLKPLYLIWMIFSIIIGWFMTKIILSVIYFFIITPISIFVKYYRKNSSMLIISEQDISYWNDIDINKMKQHNYEKQY